MVEDNFRLGRPGTFAILLPGISVSNLTETDLFTFLETLSIPEFNDFDIIFWERNGKGFTRIQEVPYEKVLL